MIISSIEAMLRVAMCKTRSRASGACPAPALQLNAIAERCERTAEVMSEHCEEGVRRFIDPG